MTRREEEGIKELEGKERGKEQEEKEDMIMRKMRK
jgi:hypothetical protein